MPGLSIFHRPNNDIDGVAKRFGLTRRFVEGRLRLATLAEPIFEALSDREALGSTGLGNGIAIPHGKLAGLSGVTAVFARLDTPVDFEAVDDQPVDLLMMLLAPVGAGADHLKALARVARLLRNESIVDALRHARDARELYAILTQPIAQAA